MSHGCVFDAQRARADAVAAYYAAVGAYFQALGRPGGAPVGVLHFESDVGFRDFERYIGGARTLLEGLGDSGIGGRCVRDGDVGGRAVGVIGDGVGALRPDDSGLPDGGGDPEGEERVAGVDGGESGRPVVGDDQVDGGDRGEVSRGLGGSVGAGDCIPGADVRGPNWERNRAARAAKKAKRALRNGGAGRCDSGRGADAAGGFARGGGLPGCEVDAERVRKSLQDKWVAENALAAAKARRALEVEESRDVEQLKRAARTRVQRGLERDMVAIEKSHATLKATGNVPGFPPAGFAETVVDSVPELSGGCTISPDSSASQAEFRAMAKKCADLEERLQKMSEMTGLRPEHLDLYEKKVWTDTRENGVVLDEMYPDGYVKNDEFAPDGKFIVIPV